MIVDRAQHEGVAFPISVGSKGNLTALKSDSRFTLNNGHHQTGPAGPFRANNRHQTMSTTQAYRPNQLCLSRFVNDNIGKRC
jgi:hypothetical protein